VMVIGGGLAGCEAAYHLAEQGIRVRLAEMRPVKMTPVHQTGCLAELVCSNSLKSQDLGTAQGLLKAEMRELGSLLLQCAETARVPAGSALAVDRELFSTRVTDVIRSHPLIKVVNQEVKALPVSDIAVVATGPLTSESLALAISDVTGEEHLFFYDAVAPIVTAESLNMDKVFRASRYGKGGDDYLNCPFTRDEYERFYAALVEADIHEGHPVDRNLFFESCMPIEVMARRGIESLRFGPMRPVGLASPTGDKSYAVLQLRQEDQNGTLYSLVGFQTRLRWREQERVFRLIPGLENADFVRYGVMHRNTYINSPRLLEATLQFKVSPNLFFGGQITGCEGYMESAATGILAGINAARMVRGEPLLALPDTTLLGALTLHISSAPGGNFQPMNANFGLLPPLEKKIKIKKARYQAYSQRSLTELKGFLEQWGL
ncbi:MAG: methylenetetrahydrofolate--tRNA-(uracil(54)-C(5))-methyltransferase (FADH(2)-oxidizing) TrmFO, partial [Syntrophomonadaceae bacterium]|nr:methylenetetrahydrofolate--tRNA-(uracil(54)-C(5))-methyltransferase (FADH(2)-oxidizing) TrmFO [Syntrophomonadaceae bacterium]